MRPAACAKRTTDAARPGDSPGHTLQGGGGIRTLHVIKSRGMPHSDSSHELKFTSGGMRVRNAVEVSQ
jgi:KaiC/GvpD/RAD55 family RecA-like ATPase